jgi:hypothetical protein
MADALSLLRQFTIENKEYTSENDRFVFNDLAYPKDIKTNYLVYGLVFIFFQIYLLLILFYLVPGKIIHLKIIIHSKVLFFY